MDYDKILMDSFTLSKEKGRILLRESSQGESSGLRVRCEGSLKTHYDAYLLLANAYVSLRLRVQNAVPAQPCVGKY